MKKKIMSVIVMVAVLVTMLSTTVFAASSPTTAHEISYKMQNAADWFAGAVAENLDGAATADIVDGAAYPIFLVKRSGLQSENVTNLENFFLKALKENISANNGVIIGTKGYETVDTYCNVILALTIMGKDPKNFEGKNILEMLSVDISSNYGSVMYPTSPYNLVTMEAVLGYYKDYSAAIEGQYNLIDAAVIKTYVKNSTIDEDYVMKSSVNYYGVTDTLATFTEGTDYSFDSNGYLHIANDTIMNALANSQSYYKNYFAQEPDWTTGGDPYLVVNVPYTGTGFFNYGFSVDTDAKMSMGLLNCKDKTASYDTRDNTDPATKVTVNEALTTALAHVVGSIDKNGQVDGFGFGVNANSTGLALAAMSTYGKTVEADKLFNGLLEWQDATGGFISDYTKAVDASATKDALEGLIAYFYMYCGYGYMFDLSVNPSETAQTNEVQMTTPANATWVASNGDWFTVSSPLPLSELLDIQIDGKSVFGDYISTDENGVMTFAAIGGGTIRVWEGSTYVSFSPEFMSTLGNGEHTVRIQSTTGFAESSFTVQAATPSTGDTANIAMYIAIAGVGAAVVTAAFVSKKRSSECE